MPLEPVSATVSAIAASLSGFALYDNRIKTGLQKNTFIYQYSAEVRKWAERGITALGDSIRLASSMRIAETKEFEAERKKLVREVSVIWDCGRLLFPNIDIETYGGEKEPANKGFRPLVLECLATVHVLLEALEKAPQGEASLYQGCITKINKVFISASQIHGQTTLMREILASVLFPGKSTKTNDSIENRQQEFENYEKAMLLQLIQARGSIDQSGNFDILSAAKALRVDTSRWRVHTVAETDLLKQETPGEAKP